MLKLNLIKNVLTLIIIDLKNNQRFFKIQIKSKYACFTQ